MVTSDRIRVLRSAYDYAYELVTSDHAVHVAAVAKACAYRLDVDLALRQGAALTIWLDDVGTLKAFRLRRSKATLTAGRVDEWARSPDGRHLFFDQSGVDLNGPFRALPLHEGAITSRVGGRFDPFSKRAATHRGTDYAVPIGTAVLAIADGHVKALGTSRTSGRYVVLVHGGGYTSTYRHLQRFAAGLAPGTRVHRDDVIALSGSSGRSTGPHLHYELARNGRLVDPTRFLPTSRRRLVGAALVAHQQNLQRLEDAR